MLRTCSSALLLSNVPQFVNHISEIAKAEGVELDIADEWNTNYRLNNEVIICGSKYLPYLNVTDYHKIRLVLKSTESVTGFIQMGITHFVFDFNNKKEVSFAFLVDSQGESSDTLSDIISKTGQSRFSNDRYDFDFKTNRFKYCGVGIYLRESEKIYLANWLLLNRKENDKRVLLCRMRKKFGKAFLKDVNRLGQYEGGNNG